MKLIVPTALALCLSVASAQTPQFTDPANLRGERVQPRDGRELPVDQGARGLEQLLRRLNTSASVMNIVAHPDDEDGGMLTDYSRGLGARVADLSLNRGEGGQNAMTGDFEDALGLLRTQELLASDRYTGVDQFFGTEVDFGFSKTKEEAFAKWGHDRVLYDVVRAIRLYRPLVLTSTWIGGVTDGHGQHQAAGQIAQEAFVAAGDPKVFPELTAEGILPWQPLRIYARVPMQSISAKGLFDYATGQYTPAKFTNYVTGEVTTTVPSADVIVHEGTPDALLDGKTYVQFARLGLAQQKSQVGTNDRRAPAGAFDVAYHLYGDKVPTISNHPESSDSRVPQGFSLGSHSLRKDVGFSPEGMLSPDVGPNFFTGIDTSLEGIVGDDAPASLKSAIQELATHIAAATRSFSPVHTATIAPELAEAMTSVQRAITLCEQIGIPPELRASVQHELHIKQVQLNDALALALGLSFDATAHDAEAVVHSKIVITTQLSSTYTGNVEATNEWVENSMGKKYESDTQKDRNPFVNADRRFVRTLTTTSDLTFAMSRPYFERSSIEQPLYRMLVPELRNAPATPSALSAWVTATFRGTLITLGRIVHSGTQPLTLVPDAAIGTDHSAQVLLPGTMTLSLQPTVKLSPNTTGTLHLNVPQNWKVKPVSQPLTTAELPFRISLLSSPSPSTATIALEADTRLGNHITEGYRAVGYGDLPHTNYYTPATTRIVPVDLKLPTRHNIAYLPGTGDAVPEALTSIGLTPTLLTVTDLTADKLKPYDTVILGVRAYAAHPELHGAPTQALLEYARNGGNVVVQYQTPEFTADDAPYPLSLGSNEKVVDEVAPVQLLEPGTNRYPEASASGLIAAKKEGVLTPGYALLNEPNQLTPADFNNWVEERGHGFLSTWDAHYTALTETHDPGQAPQRGGLITTPLGNNYGKHGRWTYVAFALYRQLPEAVPGAFRLFVNLINP